MNRLSRIALLLSTFVAGLSGAAWAHPLDPLTADEIRAAAAIAKSDARLAKAAFASVVLQEPSKADVVASTSGRFDRRPSGAARRHGRSRRCSRPSSISTRSVLRRSSNGVASNRACCRQSSRPASDRPDAPSVPRRPRTARRHGLRRSSSARRSWRATTRFRSTRAVARPRSAASTRGVRQRTCGVGRSNGSTRWSISGRRKS